ncbi:MAG: ASPIC/UnbV domain-containing protein [Myxococcales bacterium]
MRHDDNAPEQSVYDRSMAGVRTALGNFGDISFSGNERNNLFLNLAANSFEDISGVSGIDHPADGRAMGLVDYDRDGWLDLAIVNANSPMLQLYRNGIEKLVGPRPILAVRLRGGNHSPSPNDEFGPRDGFGAIVEVEIEGVRLIREHRAGEGFAAQNSSTLLIGLGPGAEGGKVTVRWPSGRSQELAYAAAGSLVTVFENASEAPDGSGFSLAPYHRTGLAAKAANAKRNDPPAPRIELAGRSGKDKTSARVKLFTTMATWCTACKGELPQLKHLRAEFDAEDLEILGVPVDEDDDRADLERYVQKYSPSYRMLFDLRDDQVAAVKKIVLDALRIDALPAAILTDGDGNVLRTMWQVPSVSEVRAALARDDA